MSNSDGAIAVANLPVLREDADMMPLCYEGVYIRETCWIGRRPCFTRRAIGEFLGYKKPQKAIDNLISRKPYLSNPRWSVTLTMRATDGKNYFTEVYDPVGFQFIVSESRQPIDPQVKVAIAHLVWDVAQGRLKPSKWAPDRISAIKQILSHPPTAGRGALITDLARKEGVSLTSAYRWIERMGGLKNQKGNRRKSRAVKPSEWPAERIAAIERILNHPPTAERIGLIRELAAREGVHKATVRQWIRRVGELEPYKGHPRKSRTPKSASSDGR